MILIARILSAWEGFIVRVKTVGRLSIFSSTQAESPPLALDISADLPELTRCPVALVSAGVKSILDIGRSVVLIHSNTFDLTMKCCRTLEYLVSPTHHQLCALN